MAESTYRALTEYPLSPMQQGMLFHSLDRLDAGIDVEQVLCTLEETLDVSMFLESWDAVLARHDVLRTSLAWEGRPEPVQIVQRAPKLPVSLVDWRDLDSDARLEALTALMAADRARGFDVSQAPLMRLTIATCGPAMVQVLWTFHHVILDGRSFPILLREVFGLYDAARTGRRPVLPEPRQYRAYIDWLQSQDPDASKVYWRRRLAGLTAATQLLHSVIPSKSEGAGSFELTLTTAETAQVRRFAVAAGCTLGTLVTAAWALLLSRYTGDEDVLFGVTRACRRSTIDGAEDMIGLFINTLPFRTCVARDATVFGWLAELRAEQIALRPHEHTPLARVQSWSDVPRGTPLFDTLVVFESYLMDSMLRQQGGPWIHRHFEYTGQTNYPVTLLCYADSELLLRLEYDRRLLDDLIARQMLQHVRRLLVALTENGNRCIVDVPMLETEECIDLLPAAPRPLEIQTFCLHERFERRAAETPDAPALTFGVDTLTYEALNRRANQLAHRLRRLGVTADVLVGLHFERSPELVVAILGILKAGGAYVPLDPAYPAARLAFMLDDAQVSLVVTTKALAEKFPASEAEIVCLEDVDDEAWHAPAPVAEPDNLAYVIYTSGSTGQPKGVLITHANVSRLFDASDIWFQFSRDDVWSLFHSYAFDFSVWEIWGALLYGGRLVVVPYWVSRDPDAFLDLIARERITVLNQTPSAFRQLIEADGALPARSPLAVRCVVLGGEALEVSTLRPWFERHGDERPRIVNMFGITETTVHVTYRRITQADVDAGCGSVIGVPIADLDVYVLNPRQQLLPVGVTGEIYIGGAGVARGYLHRTELTRDRFILDPVGGTGLRLYRSGDLARWLPNGELEYRGRLDDQVKIRGFRIELGEIEAIVRECPHVRDATVVALRDAGAEPRLAAYLVLDAEGSTDDVRRFVQAKLPDYMVPAAFVPIDVMPLTQNGKIDRRALPAPIAPARPDRYVGPRTDVERILTEVWGAVLRREAIGVEDNFFELGGDSILSIQVIGRCRQAGLHFTTRDLFKYPTVAALAAVVLPAAVPALERRGIGDAPLTPIEHWFVEHDFAAANHWNQAFLFEVPALAAGALERALHAVVAHHDVFRLRFRKDEQGWRSWYVASPSPVALTRVDLAGVPNEILATIIESESAAAQASLDITDGPILRVVHFASAESGASGRLLVVIHHIAADAVSWRIFLEDLEAAYTAQQLGQEPRLPHRTTSLKFWAERMVGYAAAQAKEGEASWMLGADPHAAMLPCDRVADPAMNTEESACTVTVSLTAAETEILLRHAPSAYGTQINDLLLSALVQTLLPWTGRDSVVVDVEGHGREDLFDDVDLSRTIGWFTSIYPVCLRTAPDGSTGGTIKTTKETLRGLHHRGLSFGALQYLSPDPQTREALRALPRPQLLFNYLGQVDALVAGSSLFQFASEPAGAWRGAANRRTHLLDVLALVAGGCLKLQWTYSRHVHDAATISAIASRYTDALRELLAHCLAAPNINRTPADFPLAELAQPELDDVIKRFPTLTDLYPVSAMQQLFYSMDGVNASPGFEQWEFILEGPLDAQRLRAAWQSVMTRHPILRTAFVHVGAVRPHQIVLERVEVPWHEEDWRACEAADQERLLAEFLTADRSRPFDPAHPPLMRVTLIRTGANVHRLIWTTHHLLVDGWSWPLIFSDLSAFYAPGSTGAALQPACAYREYVKWLAQTDRADDDRFWRAELEGIVDATPIPALPAPAGEPADTAMDVVRSLSPATTAALAAFARTHHVTLSTILGAAWSVVLAHHSGRSDVLFGASFAGRPGGIPGIEGMVGPCVNNVPIRVAVDSRVPVGEWLSRLHGHIGDLMRFQTTPLTEIHRCSGVPAWTRLFDSLLVVQNYLVDATVGALGDVRLRPLRCPEWTNYPATIVVRPGEQLEIKVMRSGHRFAHASAVASANDLVSVLNGLVDLGDANVGRLLALLPVDYRGLAGQAAAERRLRRGPRLAPRTEMEKALVEIWRELFDGDVGTDENYFELGVHSLMLVRAHERIRSAVKCDMPIAALFQYPTVRDLAAYLTAGAAPGRRDSGVRMRAAQQQQAYARRKALAEANNSQ